MNNKNLRICHIIAGAGLCGGMENHVIDLTSALVKQGHIVSVIAPPELACFFDKRIALYEMNLNRWRKNPFLHYQLREMLKRVDASIFHVHGNKSVEIFSRAGHSGSLAIATLHNCKKRKISLYEKMQGVVCVSARVANRLDDHIPKKIIHNSVPLFSKKSLIVANPKDFKSNKVVMAAGRFVAAKGFDILLKSIASIDGLDLWLIGDGPDRTALEKLVKDLDIEDRVWMPGNLARNEVIGLMKKCDLFVISSRHEGGPITLAEALVHCCPVISTQVGFAPELLNPEHLIEEASVEAITEKINQFFNDTEFISSYESLFEASQKLLSIDHMAEETISFYQDILKQYSSS